jgi:hypothetical protein
VAIPFKKADTSVVQEAYKSPTSAEKADPAMVAAFKEMSVGEAVEITKEAIGSSLPRSVKIQVGKAAKEAGWKLNYRNYNGGFLAKIVGPVASNGDDTAVEASVDESEGSTNGVTAETAEAPTEEPTTGRRGR